MYRVINKLKSEKRGFTLPELLVTIAIMSLAAVLMTNLVRTILRNYRVVEYQYMVQTFVKATAETFEGNVDREALSTAEEAFMFYEDLEPPTGDDHTKTFTLASCPELGEIEYSNEDYSITISPPNDDANLEILKNCYKYFITFDKHFFVIDYMDYLNISKGTDTEGNETIEYEIKSDPTKIYARNGELLFGKYEDTDYQLEIQFTYSITPFEDPDKERRPKEESVMLESETEYDYTHRSFLLNGITAEIKGVVRNTVLDQLKTTATYVSSYDLINLNQGKGVNYLSDTTSPIYAAGWNDRGLSQGLVAVDDSDPSNPYGRKLVATAAEETDDEFKARLVARNSSFGNYNSSDTLLNPTHTANIIKYRSVNTDQVITNRIGEVTVPNIYVGRPMCLLSSGTIGLNNREQILQPIRDFRDTYLRGNELGEWIIHEYYYEISPAVVKWMETVPVLKTVVIGLTRALSAASSVLVD